jgi:hypothetical protein
MEGYFNEEEGDFHTGVHPQGIQWNSNEEEIILLDKMHGTTRGTKNVKHGT